MEQWFSIVKNHTLHRKKFLRPADFITKMFSSLQGRYTQHQMMHNLDGLSQSASPKQQTIDQQEEQWARRSISERSAKRRSKYFDPPEAVPQPKRRKTKQTPAIIQRIRQLRYNEILSHVIQLLFTLTHTTFIIKLKYCRSNLCRKHVSLSLPSHKGQKKVLHHSELKTLQPHKLLAGEVRKKTDSYLWEMLRQLKIKTIEK